MRLRIVQKDINTTGFGDYVSTADGTGLDLVCFCELSATGCLYEPREVPPLQKWLDELSAFDIGVMFGAARQEGDVFYNSYVYYQDGRYSLYNKINLFPPFNEDQVYQPGTAPGLFETPLASFGAAICYDIRFPDVFTRLAQLCVPYIVIPAAFPRVRIDDYRRLLTERAKETGATVIGINAVGDDGTNEFGGSSMVVQSDGTVVAQAGETEEAVLDIELPDRPQES